MEHFYQTIYGHFNYHDIYNLILQKLPSGSTVVEIGVFYGRSLAYAGVEIINSGKDIKLFGVDNFLGSPNETSSVGWGNVTDDTYIQCINNLEPIKAITTIIKGNSVDVASQFDNKSLDFVYIDASHSYQYIKADINAWLPKIKKNGFIGGHDYEHYDPEHLDGGVTRAVDDVFGKKNITIVNKCQSWLYEVKY